MRITTLFTMSLVAALSAAPATAPAQVNVDVRIGARLGPEIGVYAYSPERYGDWRRSYRRWTPVTLYEYHNHFYRHSVRGARAVVVYQYHNEYFLPPDDRTWVNSDRRYNYRRRPDDTDRGRVRPWENGGASVEVNLGPEITFFDYAPQWAGDWRRNYQQWTPVTLYELNGHYYANSGNGARAVMLYRYRNEYFLPPTDPTWNGFDRRFDYRHAPNDQDRGRGHRRP